MTTTPLQALLFILPLGLDTLGVSLSLGMKRAASSPAGREGGTRFPNWLRSALLFACAETLMPLVGLAIGYAASLLIGDAMHFAGALLLIGVGGWELWEEGRERLAEGKERASAPPDREARVAQPSREQLRWQQQFLLALSVSMDELAIGFSFGSAAVGKAISPFVFCVLLGLQGFLLTICGLAIGRTLGARLMPYREWSELLGAALLVALGIWLLFS